MTDLLARLGDRLNPIVVKEARQAVNSRLVASGLLLFLVVQLTAMLLMLSGSSADADATDLRVGRNVFTFVQGILLATCMLFIPAMTGARLAGERSDVNVDLLFVSSLTPRAVVAGKLAVAAAVALLIFSACAPFMAFAYVLRGLDVPTILLVLAGDFLAVLLGTMLALLLAAIPANRGLRVMLGLGGVIGLAYLFVGAVAATSGFLQFGVGDTDSWEFWGAVAGLAGLAVGSIGLLFVWAVALVSPPTANRALPVRVYTLGFWLAAGVGCAVWSHQAGEPDPVMAWGCAATSLFALQLLVAASERDAWGTRVARRIPRNPLLRPGAFLLYSGAAGGLLFGVLGGAVSVAATGLWCGLYYPTAYAVSNAVEGVLKVCGLTLGYTYCYCLTAILVRRFARSGTFPAGVTWFVALTLFGLASTLPMIAQFTLFDRRYQHGFPDEVVWLHLANPTVMIPLAASDVESRFGMTTAFVSVWAAAVTLLNAPWLLNQVTNFHPPRAPK